MVDRVSSPLPAAPEDRVVVADGAMGTILRPDGVMLDDSAGHDGCDEIFDGIGPDGARDLRRACPEAGVDSDRTNTSGATLPNLADHGIPDWIFTPSEAGGALVREAAEPGQSRSFAGSGTTPPHAESVEQAKRLLAGSANAVIVKAPPGRPRTKASITGAKRTMAADGGVVPTTARLIAEPTGMTPQGVGTEAAPTAPEPPGIDLIGLTCTPGPAGSPPSRPQNLQPHPERPTFIAPHPEAKYLNV